MFSLDVFDGNHGLWETILGFLVHNIPVFILSIILLISWKYEIVSGIGFISGGIFYIAILTIASFKSGFSWWFVVWALQISGVAFLIGIFFLIGWIKKKKMT